MKTMKRVLWILLILLVVLVIIGFGLFRHISGRAVPDYNNDLPLKGLHAPVEVIRDSFAIPHIYAGDEHDLYMAVGYLMAEDRLWQMDMLRHVTEGRLSEIFGAEYVETDLLLRSLRFREKSEKILLQADSASLLALNAFADGINQFIAANQNHLPPEFAILRYKPETWIPCHSLNLIGYMAWDLKAGWSEIILSFVRQAVDSARYRQLQPDLKRKQPTVYPLDDAGSFSSLVPDLLLKSARLRGLGADVLEASNNWAVSGSRSTTGKPILANDMHLGLNVPGIWYQMHQVVTGKLNVTGVALPGAPVIICGHNDSIAWGMTNTYVDNLDFYEEKIKPGDSNYYEYKGDWLKFDNVKTTITISNGEQVEKTLRFTHRGPVVSSFKKLPGNVVTMHWVGDEPSDEFRAIMGVNRAHNWKEFNESLKTFNSISQNIAYADANGNIGLLCAAGVPIRNRDIAGGVLPGHSDAYDWKGFIPFEELPRTYNPPTGYVASANNRTAPPDYPYHIGTWYSLPSRYNRITEMISSREVLSVQDFKVIQLDQHSHLAASYMPAFLKVLENYGTANNAQAMALEFLKNWDYNMAVNSAAAAIFETLYLSFIRCTFADELGEELFSGFNGITSISREVTDRLIESGISPWFDDITTKDRQEEFSNMVICAFINSVNELEVNQGSDPAAWEWGNQHHLILSHPLSAVNILDKAFKLSRGPYPVGGSFHTVSPYSYDSNAGFDANHGSSHRHIFDAGNWDNSITVIPTGISGIPASKHYCDQTEMYISGHYHRDHFSREKVEANALYRMKFIPEGKKVSE